LTTPADPQPRREAAPQGPTPDPRPPVVTIFGGSRVERDSPLYRQAYQMGKLLAEHGYVVCNGGYSGTMEAASRGCKEAGGRTIGVTVEIFGQRLPNEFLDEEVGTASLLMRLDKLTALADAFVVLTGSFGTLLEMALVWNLWSMQVYPDKPIILLGPAWKAAVDCLSQHLLVRDIDLAAFTFAERPEHAVTALASQQPATQPGP
jgi:uncharacterized protein (TIGR00730 family)